MVILMNKKFTKNDNSFMCDCCNTLVEKLSYTSRDHCPICLSSLHVDINPGDRANPCKGIMKPFDIEQNSKKGFVIVYKCSKCKEIHKNKSANDDSLDAIISVMNKTYEKYLQTILNKK